MDHAEATRKYAAEQYVLGELREDERDAFERHFFACGECAEAVEAGAALAANAQTVFREPALVDRQAAIPERKKWFVFGSWGFAPAAAMAACAVLAVVVGYQNLVEFPALRAGAALELAPAMVVRAARAAQGLTVSRTSAILSVTVAHEWEEPYAGYRGELERAADHRVVAAAELPATAGDITVSAGVKRFPAGSYFLNLYGLREGATEKTAVARIPVTLTD